MQDFETGMRLERLVVRHDDLGIGRLCTLRVLRDGLAVDGERVAMQATGRHQLVHHGRQPAGAKIILAQIRAGRLHVDEERHVVADFLPILDGEFDADMPRYGVEVDRRIGRTADRRTGDDRILEGGAGQDVRRLQVLAHDFDGAHAGLVGDLAALAIRRRDRGAAGQRHAERLGHRIHGRGGAHRVAVADRRRRVRDDVDEFLVVDLAGGDILPRLPDHRARARELAVVIAVEHRPAGKHDRRRVDGCRRHQTGRRGLVAAGHQHHAVERIAVEHFDQAEIGEIAVERRGRPLAGLLDGMHRKFERDAAGIADALAHALGEFQMMAIARG